MTTIVSRKNDQSRHAAAIERWDNEGGSADLVECDIGDGELLSEMRHRLGPDKLVKFLAREDSGHGHPLFAMRGRRRPHALVKTPPPGTDPNV